MDQYPIICQHDGTGEDWLRKSRIDRSEDGALRKKVFYSQTKKTLTVTHKGLPSFSSTAGEPSKELLEAFFNAHVDAVFQLRMDYDGRKGQTTPLYDVVYAEQPPRWTFNINSQRWDCVAVFEQI